MNKIARTTFTIFAAVSLILTSTITSCDKTEEEQLQTAEQTPETNEQKAADVLEIGYGAFKTTERKEVKGWFTEFELTVVNEAKKFTSKYEDAKIKINVPSLETFDSLRNKKILDSFFGFTSSQITMEAAVKSLSDSVATIEIDFNGIKRVVNFSVTQNNEGHSLQANIKLENFLALSALSSIHDKCIGSHTGDDGVA